MVKCFICDKIYEKGISVCCSRQCHNIRINSMRNYNTSKNILDKQNRIQEYNLDPLLCKRCNSPITYKAYKQKSQFCGRSCSQTFVNLSRDPTTYIKQRNSLLCTNATVLKKKGPHSKVNFLPCKTCHMIFRAQSGQKYCSIICKAGTTIRTYRRACKFNISKSLYPSLFNIDLLNTYGWYRAANHPNGYNPNGATWDHLFRIEDGFKLQISPEIISHPANAEMISWKDNISRKHSVITLEELMYRIDQFNCL